MTDGGRRVGAVSPAVGVAPSRPIHPNVGREQLDLFERMVEQGHHADDEPELDLVTTLTRDEIGEIEERLASGSTVAGVLGRPLDYHSGDESRRARHHLSAGSGHLDEDA